MSKRSTTIGTLILILAVLGLGLFFSRQREVVGVDEIGVVVTPGGGVHVYQTGERPLVLPGLQRYIRLSAKPIRYLMTEGKAISVPGPGGKPMTIGCQVRYQVADAAKLIAAQGSAAPQAAIEGMITRQVSTALAATLGKETASLDDTPTRIMLVGEVHEALRQELAPAGIEVLAFDLISW